MAKGCGKARGESHATRDWARVSEFWPNPSQLASYLCNFDNFGARCLVRATTLVDIV